ncbi:gastric triacylglycerol lipase-like [Linepithema humile]|uniref:gastric triacylglycerol lipase-like n=1 Tax=Linepithema humile TaxID=83485 RepID=UPI00351F042E
MSLPIFLLAILASVSATMLESLLTSLPELDPKDRIPEIEIAPTPAIGPEDAKLTTIELISKNGYNGELHTVTTSDGYILELHRITGRANSTKPKVQKSIAFVMHGILCSLAAWVLAGSKKSLGFILADAGYDVWLGNARGSLYAREHTHSSVKEKDYWDFRCG